MRIARRGTKFAGTSMIAKLFMLMIRAYQVTLSRLILAVFGPVCRFEPSCSRYAFECIRMHGAWRGGLLSVKRLSKCHPLHPGGYDPPPLPAEPPAPPSRPPVSTDARG